MNKSVRIILLMYLSVVCSPVLAQKRESIVDKTTINEVQKSVKAQMPGAKIKKIKYDDGGVYIGECNKRVRQGIGAMFFADSSVFVGMWDSDTISIKGKMTYADGSTYDGGWVAGLYDGKGVREFPNKDRYDGEWVAGKQQGKGKMTYADGSTYDGGWVAGLYEGKGVREFPNKDRYDGEWVAGKQQGEGKMTYADGREYKGEWKDGKREGKGTTNYDDGRKYEGDWKDGNRDGKGVLTYSDGSKYEGDWKDDKIEGNGKYTYAKGEFSGQWSNWLFISGSININKNVYTINGNINNSSFCGDLILSNEEYSGTWKGDGWFSGNYVFKGKHGKYHFTGDMLFGNVEKGVLSFGDKTTVIEDCRKDGEGLCFTCSFGNNRHDVLCFPTENKEELLNVLSSVSLPGILSRNRMYSEFLKEETFYFVKEFYPMEGVDQAMYLSFYKDGYAVLKWKNRRHHYDAKDFFTNKQSSNSQQSTSTCPLCCGEGTFVNHDFKIDGTPYTKIIKCYVCKGKGKVKSDNKEAQYVRNTYDYAFAESLVYYDSRGRSSEEVARENGYLVLHYDVNGDVVTIREFGKSFRLMKNGNLCTNDGEEFYTIERGNEYFNDFRALVDEHKKQYKTICVSSSDASDIKLDWTISDNTVFYASTKKEAIKVKNANIVSHDYSEGYGRIVLDSTIDVIKEKEENSRMSSTAMSTMVANKDNTFSGATVVTFVVNESSILNESDPATLKWLFVPFMVSEVSFSDKHTKPLSIVISGDAPKLSGKLPEHSSAYFLNTDITNEEFSSWKDYLIDFDKIYVFSWLSRIMNNLNHE